MTETKVNLGVVMDPIHAINPKKDSTLAMLLAAQRRGWGLFYMEQSDLGLRDGTPYARRRALEVRDDAHDWYTLGPVAQGPLDDLNVVIMRKDPPFDMEYVYTTYVLQRAQDSGVMVVNDPASLRDINEKAYTAWFGDLCPPTLITSSTGDIRAFAEEQGRIVVKPLDGMGGTSVFMLEPDDLNANVIMETLTHGGTRFAMAQRHVPAIATDGDKRILLVDGEPVPYALARIPPAGDLRGNLAVGGRGEGRPLTERDREICARIGPVLAAKGVIFVGLDVIGDYLTEVNVTSPTCIRELDNAFDLDIAGDLMRAIADRLASGGR